MYCSRSFRFPRQTGSTVAVDQRLGRKHGDLKSCLTENYQEAYKLNINLLINKTFNSNFRISARFTSIITELDCWERHKEEEKEGRGILKKRMLNSPVGTEENQQQTQNGRGPGRDSYRTGIPTVKLKFPSSERVLQSEDRILIHIPRAVCWCIQPQTM